MKTHRQRALFVCALVVGGCLLQAAQDGADWGIPKREYNPDVFQVSTLDALSLGLYQGIYPIEDLKRHGNFGLGTFEGIDGEMTVLDGHFYHFRSDGIVTEESGDTRIPFAVLTEFRPGIRFSISAVSMAKLGEEIDARLPSNNLFYAIRIHGNFSELTTRAIPKLFPPYPPLADAVAQQVKFPLQNIDGTMVAFRCPPWVKGINQVGYHYHFISDDRTVGGHALSFTTGTVSVEVQLLQQNSIWVPDKGPFLSAPLPVSP